MYIVRISYRDGEVAYFVTDDIVKLYRSFNNNVDKVAVLTDEAIVSVSGEQLDAEEFLITACREFCISLSDIRGPVRRNLLVQYRKAISHVLSTRYNLSLHEIADVMYRDHTTIRSQLKSQVAPDLLERLSESNLLKYRL